MAEPTEGFYAWPERPSEAHWLADHWYVLRPPPAPFPDIPEGYDWPRAVWGPPGTIWATLGAGSEPVPGGDADSHLKSLLRFLRKLGLKSGFAGTPDGVTTVQFEVPARWADPALPVDWSQMRYAQTVIHGKLGTVEEVAHVLKWVHSSGPNATVDAAALQAFSDAVRDRWVAFLASSVSGYQDGVRSLLTDGLVYDEVRTSYLELTGPAAKPTYVVPTVYSAITPAAGQGKGGGAALPWEVAMCVSLNTNFRGPRVRGRMYLGGLATKLMDVGGLFSGSTAREIGAKFGTDFVGNLNANSAFDLHVVSGRYATSAPVQGVRIGVVPDSQRRRRKNQPESAQLVWGTGVGLAGA